MPGAVNWVRKDEDIAIRKYLLGEMRISLALQFPAKQGSWCTAFKGSCSSLLLPQISQAELSSSSEKDDGEGIWWKNKTSHQNS